jgi:hypothetical protein
VPYISTVYTHLLVIIVLGAGEGASGSSAVKRACNWH